MCRLLSLRLRVQLASYESFMFASDMRIITSRAKTTTSARDYVRMGFSRSLFPCYFCPRCNDQTYKIRESKNSTIASGINNEWNERERRNSSWEEEKLFFVFTLKFASYLEFLLADYLSHSSSKNKLDLCGLDTEFELWRTNCNSI